MDDYYERAIKEEVARQPDEEIKKSHQKTYLIFVGVSILLLVITAYLFFKPITIISQVTGANIRPGSSLSSTENSTNSDDITIQSDVAVQGDMVNINIKVKGIEKEDVLNFIRNFKA